MCSFLLNVSCFFCTGSLHSTSFFLQLLENCVVSSTKPVLLAWQALIFCYWTRVLIKSGASLTSFFFLLIFKLRCRLFTVFQVYNMVIHNFVDYNPLINIIMYWLCSLYYTTYPCSLFILYTVVCRLTNLMLELLDMCQDMF